MTLFAALTAKDDGDSNNNASSSSPPEAIQLHADRVIDFLNGTTIHLNPAADTSSSKASGDGTTADNKEGSTGNSNNSGEGRSRYFSSLSYQAVQTQQDDGPSLPNKSAGAAGANSAAARQHLRPDLGVWDCRVQNKNNNNGVEAPAMILKRVVIDKKSHNKAASNSLVEEGETAVAVGNTNDNDVIQPPIVMAVDMSHPNEIQPVIEQMRNVILKVYESKETTTSMPTNSQTCTTSMKSLQNSVFGRTLIQEEVKGSSTSSGDRIALILAVIVPSSISPSASATEEYAERQARALILYHLHKFCLEVDCTLCFVGEKGSSDAGDATGGSEDEKKAEGAAENDPLLGRNSTMSIDELSLVIRRVAMGLSPVEQNDIVDMEGEKEEAKSEGKEGDDETSPQQRPPSIHVPGSHDAELIHGAYLRNASCEGRWDASKDDLNVALPPRSSKTAAASSKEETKDEKDAPVGDEDWLSQLASSIGLSPDAAASSSSSAAGTSAPDALTPNAAERKKKDRTSGVASKKRLTRVESRRNKGDAKPKDEKEVMNFFDNLLKK